MLKKGARNEFLRHFYFLGKLVGSIAAIIGFIILLRKELYLFVLVLCAVVILSLIAQLIYSYKRRRYLFRSSWLNICSCFLVGFILGGISGFVLVPEGCTRVINAVRGEPHPVPAPTLVPTSTISPTPTFMPVSLPKLDIRVTNEKFTWDNPSDVMRINATRPITITVDPDGKSQAQCTKWDIQPEPRREPESGGCNIEFYASSFMQTTVTVTVSINNRKEKRILGFIP
jgi:hypothetical protein